MEYQRRLTRRCSPGPDWSRCTKNRAGRKEERSCSQKVRQGRSHADSDTNTKDIRKLYIGN